MVNVNMPVRRSPFDDGKLRMTKAQGWQETLDELDRRRRARSGDGWRGAAGQASRKGKLDARARLEHLLDKGTFREFGTLVGGDIAADGIVAGSGMHRRLTGDGRGRGLHHAGGQHRPGGNSKRYRIAELALRDRIPLVMLLEGAGFRPSGEHYGRTPTDLLAQAQCSGKVPPVGGLLGPSAGHGALVAPVCDFTDHEPPGRDLHRRPAGRERVHRRGDFEGGPRRSERRAGQRGHPQRRRGRRSGARRHPPVPVLLPAERVVVSRAATCRRGERTAADPRAARHRAPRQPPRLRHARGARRRCSTIRTGSRCSRSSGRAIICALAHLGGHPVAVVANQPKVMAGSIDADAADKAAHFIMVADSFHLPIVFLADNPGMLPGSRSEKSGVLRSGARMFAAQTAADDAQAARDAAQGLRFRVDGDVAAGLRQPERDVRLSGRDDGCDERGRAEPRVECRRGHEAKLRKAEVEASFRSAEHLGFDELIDPEETRDALLSALQRGIYSRQAAAEPVSRTVITP